MSPQRKIHIVNPLWNAAGGSEWHAIELYRLLSPHAEVKLWTEHRPDPELVAACPIHTIDPGLGVFPRQGTLVFMGVYKLPGPWIAQAKPRRTIIAYNTAAPRLLDRFMKWLNAHQIKRGEVTFASQALRDKTRLPGLIELSFVDLNRFK